MFASRCAQRGLGAGGIPAVGRAAAIAAEDDLFPIVAGTDMVFVTAGMGGGTGSGAAPVVAELAKQAGCLTVGIVTKPFSFEGQRRMNQAIEAIDTLQESVDILVTVSNDKLLEIVPEGMPLNEAFSIADEILRQGIMGISEIIAKPGLINVDFADVRSVMQDAGPALMGIGTGVGKTRAYDAAVAAISSPLLDFPIEKARGVVFTITGNSEMSLTEVNEVAAVISEICSDVSAAASPLPATPRRSPRPTRLAPLARHVAGCEHHLWHIGRRDLQRRDLRHGRRHLLRYATASRGATAHPDLCAQAARWGPTVAAARPLRPTRARYAQAAVLGPLLSALSGRSRACCGWCVCSRSVLARSERSRPKQRRTHLYRVDLTAQRQV